MKPRFIPRALGAIAGVALAGSLVASARPATDVPSLPATITVSVPASGELGTAPAAPRPVLEAATLAPHARPAQASFDLRNQTGEELAIAWEAEAAATGLDGLLRVRLSSAGVVLSDGTLQALRRAGEPTLALRPGESAEIELRAWIPAAVETGYESGRADISLIPEVSRVER